MVVVMTFTIYTCDTTVAKLLDAITMQTYRSNLKGAIMKYA